VSRTARGSSCLWQVARRPTRAWFRGPLTEEQQRIVTEERASHPPPRVRDKRLVLWLLPGGLTRPKAAEMAKLGRATVPRYVAACRDGGWDGRRQCDVPGPLSEWAAFRDRIRASVEPKPVGTSAEAGERLPQLTGLRRGPTPGRKVLKDRGLQFHRVHALCVPPPKTWPRTSQPRPRFTTPP
jgi:transposase